jgi:transcriptional regulator with XRE-family HTH domain
MPTTGPDLRAERRAADITASDVSRRMGVSRQTVHGIEGRAVLTVQTVQKYRKALADAIKASQAKVA